MLTVSCAYILAPQRLRVGDAVVIRRPEGRHKARQRDAPGRLIPVGTIIHNVELKPGARAARWLVLPGTYRSAGRQGFRVTPRSS